MAFALALTLASPAGAAPAPRPALSLLPASTASAPAPDTALWWHSAGDAVLAQLIERGLATDKPLACEALSLRSRAGKARSRDRRIDRRIVRLFDTSAAEADNAELQARAYDYADHRAGLAARIATTYLEVRRLQEVAALRAKMQAQFRDNAEIAKFRREAGLVDGLDVGLAGSLVAINGDGLDTNRQTLDDRIAALATLSGTDETGLRAALGEDGKVPDLAIAGATVTPPGAGDAARDLTLDALHRADIYALERRLVAGLLRADVRMEDVAAALAAPASAATDGPADDKAALPARSLARLRAAEADALATLARARDGQGATNERLAGLDRKLREARANAASARVAYRNGMVPFAALYAAEAAGSGLAEAGIAARAARAAGVVTQARALGLGWVDADLDPGPAGITGTEVLVCD